VDTLTAIIGAAILLILAVPIIEIAVKRPGIFLELHAGTRAFAEAPLRDAGKTEGAAGDRMIPANGSKLEATHSDGDRLAA
jgi:hypothetical protein